MRDQNDFVKIEFLITLNNDFVVQRFFNIKGYNLESKNSDELYDYIKSLSNLLKNKLKNKSVFYMLDNRPQIEEFPSILDTSKTDKNEIFNILLKCGNETIFHRIIDAKIYPPKVRYTLDVRPIVKTILKDLTDILSSRKLSFNYLNNINN